MAAPAVPASGDIVVVVSPSLQEKLPLPLTPLAPLVHTRLLPFLGITYLIQLAGFVYSVDPASARRMAPLSLLSYATATAYGRWADRRALARREAQREAQAAEEGWTAEAQAEKDAEERDKLNVGRRMGVWLFGAMNVLVAATIGVMSHFGRLSL